MQRLFALCIFLVLFIPGTLRAATYLLIPFHNASGQPNLDWIGESITETVREVLVSYNLSAIGREEREEAAHGLSILPTALLTKATVIRLGRRLNADRVIFGEFVFAPDDGSESASSGQIELRARCIELDHGKRGPEWEERGKMAELSEMQTRLSWRLLRYAGPAATPEEPEFLKSRPAVRIDAMENYIRGLLAPALEQKHRYFTQAVNLEPEFSQPCFQLGKLQWEENAYRSAAQWLARVKPADAHYLEASFLLGLCRYHTGDYAGASAAFELVARSAPGHEVFNNLAIAQYRRGVLEAAQNLQKALEGAPEDPDYHFNAGYMLWRQGDLAAAAQHFRNVLESDTEDVEARQMLERCLNQSGPRRGDLSGEGLERLKENYTEISGYARDLGEEPNGS